MKFKKYSTHVHEGKVSYRKNMAAITLELNSESFSYLVNHLGKPQVVLSYAEAESLALALLTTVEINKT